MLSSLTSSAPEQNELSPRPTPSLPSRCSPLTPPLISPRPVRSSPTPSIRRVSSGKFPPPPPPLCPISSSSSPRNLLMISPTPDSLTPPLLTSPNYSPLLKTQSVTPPLIPSARGHPKRKPSSSAVYPHPDPYEQEEEHRTPPISPPWIIISDPSSSNLSSMSSLASIGDSPPPPTKEKRRSSRRASLKRKSRLQKKKVEKKGEGPVLEELDPSFSSSSNSLGSDLSDSSITVATTPLQENNNTVFLSALPESEVLFFPLPPKKKQEKPEGGIVTISSLRDALGKEEEEQRAKGHLELRGATQMVLLSYLCSPLATKKFISTFLLTFPAFMSPLDVFDGLVLAVEKAGAGGGCGQETRKRVRGIFLQWMTRFFEEDWSKGLQEKFLAFLKTESGGLLENPPPSYPTRSPPHSPPCSPPSESPLQKKPSLRSHMKACADVQREANSRPSPARNSSCPALLPSKIRKKGVEKGVENEWKKSKTLISKSTLSKEKEQGKGKGTKMTIDMFKDEEIAETLSSYSFSLFSSFREREFLNNITNNNNKNKNNKNNKNNKTNKNKPLGVPSPLTQLINLFNHLSMWVTSEIVTQPKLSDRLHLLEKFTHVAHLLHHNHHNHHLAFALLSGLTKACIHNMPTTLSSLPPSPTSTLRSLEGIFSPANNFKSYRGEVEASSPPCLPYLGLFLQDLVFLNDGNPNHVKGKGEEGEGEGLINFGKWSRISEVIFDVTLCRYEGGGKGGEGTVNESFLWWVMNEAVVLEEKEQYRWARRVDPKDTEVVIAEFLEGEKEMMGKIEGLEGELKGEREKGAERERELMKRIEELERELGRGEGK